MYLQGPLSSGTQSKFRILEPVGAPKKPFPVPYPEELTVFDYQFIKEVNIHVYHDQFYLSLFLSLSLSGTGPVGPMDRSHC